MITQEDISNKKAVVTGGSSGIGLATASALSNLNVKVVSADLKEPDEGPSGIYHFNVDVSDQSQVDSLFHNTIQTIGVPDILICNAGKGIHEKLSEGDPEKWGRIVEVNLMGALRVIRAFVPGMLERGSGDVVFVSSVAANKPYAWGGVYSATKAALEAVAETLRQEVLPKVRVTTIVPGVVDSAFFRNMVGGGHDPDTIGWGALSPDDVADAVVYAVTRPKGVSLNRMVIRPSAQPM
jgi:NADP-dependent 3-hydroxy acid dehydrogenase YdfG